MNMLVSARDLRKNYGSLTAVDGISFEIREGECFGFLGPNGAGKTTTVKMIHCVSPVTSGTLIVNGLPAHINKKPWTLPWSSPQPENCLNYRPTRRTAMRLPHFSWSVASPTCYFHHV